MDKNLKIPFEKRHIFTEPLDRLIAGSRSETISVVKKELQGYLDDKWGISVYLVGDIVTKDFLADDFLKNFIKVCIIDEKTQRHKVEIDYEDVFEEIIEMENPAGTIHSKSWSVLKDIIDSGKKAVINITEGEEDLLVIPLVLALPVEKKHKHLVFYGQPPITDAKISIPQGIVIADITEEIKKNVNLLVSIMEEI